MAEMQRPDQQRTAHGRSVRARYPDRWPAEMRVDVLAALLDFETTGLLWKAIARGEAPRPTAYRIRHNRREPIWALELCLAFVARRHNVRNNGNPEAEDIRSLL
jgi:hypothetical protein